VASSGVQAGEIIRPPYVRAWSYDDPNVAATLTAAGRVFVYLYGGPDGGYGFRVVALDAASGSTVWGPVVLGGAYFGAGITYADGRLIALDRDGVLTALDAATGQQLWQADLPYQYNFSYAPTAFRGVVYITGGGNGSSLYAVSATTGTLLWSRNAGQGEASPVVVDDSGVYWALGCHETLAYHLDGSTKWYRPADCGQEGSGSASLHDGRLYLSGGPNLVLDAATGGSLGRYPFSWVPPTFSGSRLVVLRWRTLTAIDQSTGSTAWVDAGDGTFQSAPTLAGGFVYIGGSAGGLFAIDASTGRTAWSAELPQQFGGAGLHSVTVGGGHVLAIHDQGLTAFAEPPVSVAGPRRVLKGSSAPLQLHGAPGAAVEVWFRPAGAPSYTNGRTVVMDATGHGTTTWTFTATTTYYATSGGATSAAATTTVVPTVTLRPGEPPTAATTFLSNPRHDSSQPGETIGGARSRWAGSTTSLALPTTAAGCSC